MTETWYVMEDGSVGDPRMVKCDQDGKLVHKDGRKVAYAPHGPRSRMVDTETAHAPAQNREMKPAKPRRTYKTRGAAAEPPAEMPLDTPQGGEAADRDPQA